MTSDTLNASLYAQELAQEGLPIEIVDMDPVSATAISIFLNEMHKDINAHRECP